MTTPDWLAPTRPTKYEIEEINSSIATSQRQLDDTIPPYPTTKATQELLVQTYESFFERLVEQLAAGELIGDIIQSDPRGINVGHFMTWVMSSSERERRIDEAEKIGARILVGRMVKIATGVDSLEEIERSKLRIDTLWKVAQSHNRNRYGQRDASTVSPFGQGGVVINIVPVETPRAEKVIDPTSTPLVIEQAPDKTNG